MNAASPADLREANRRFQKVMAYLQPPDPGIAPDIPKRTLSRWVKQFREAEIKYGCGYIGLLPKTRQRVRGRNPASAV